MISKYLNTLKKYWYFFGLYRPYLSAWSLVKLPLLLLGVSITISFMGGTTTINGLSNLFFTCNLGVLRNEMDYAEESDKVRFVFNGKTVVFPKAIEDERAYWFIRNNVLNTFFLEEYSRLDVAGKHVLDLGSCIGDASIYFVLKGAESVVTLEPVPYFADLAQSAFDANEMANKITLVRAAIPVVPWRRYSGPKLLGVSPVEDGEIRRPEDLFLLMPEGSVMKMDVELGELSILTVDDAVLRRFSEIILEYHSREYTLLVNKLKHAGFDINLDGPYSDARYECTGIIYAHIATNLPPPLAPGLGTN